VVPEKQGLKPDKNLSPLKIIISLSSGSRKTRIETGVQNGKKFQVSVV